VKVKVEVEWSEDRKVRVLGQCGFLASRERGSESGMKGEIAGERGWRDFGNRSSLVADRYRGLSVISQSSGSRGWILLDGE
jgi:hypothetical protein